MNKRTFLIADVSCGFGYETTKQLLQQRDTVIGTIRKIDSVKMVNRMIESVAISPYPFAYGAGFSIPCRNPLQIKNQSGRF